MSSTTSTEKRLNLDSSMNSTVKDHNVTHEISSASHISNPVIYTEIQKKQTDNSNTFSHPEPARKRNINCRYFAKGICNLGPRCRYKHEIYDYSKSTPVAGVYNTDVQTYYNKPVTSDYSNPESNTEMYNSEASNVPASYYQTKPTCPNYKFGRCEEYEVCKQTYNHPRRCRDMLTFGECRNGENCTYYHPKICKNSMESLKCTNLKCPYLIAVVT